MEKNSPIWTLGELATIFGGTLEGDPEAVVERPVPAGDADGKGLTFAESERYFERADSVEVGAILVTESMPKGRSAVIRVAHPRRSFGQFLGMCARPLPLDSGIHPTAVISGDAWIDPTAQIGAFAVVESGVRIGAGTKIYAHSYIGENCELGESVTVYPHAVLYRDVSVGARSVIHAHAVIGADGFGFVWNGTQQQRVPQAGTVEIGDDVEVGALTAIDRATAGATRINAGVKIDNLVQVGHNVTIGNHTVIAALVGVSGSCHIGSRVVIAGQTALSDHVTVGDDITLAGRTGVTSDLTAPGPYFGFPARPFREATRIMAATGKLPDFVRRLRRLEQAMDVKDITEDQS
jgi:UDP-3-O-[3-hydroxymyristoyl] glucosamine N-acyltransferase